MVRTKGQKLWQKARNVVTALGAFTSYSKMDLSNGNHSERRAMPEQPPPKRETKKGCIALSACLLLVVVVIVATAVGVTVSKKDSGGDSGGAVSASSVAAVCSNTLYPDVCNNTLSGADMKNPQKYVQVAMRAAMAAINQSLHVVNDLQLSSPEQNGTQYSTLLMCKEVLGDCLDQLNTSLYGVADLKLQSARSEVSDIQQFMSAALTYQDTCLSGIQEFGVWNGTQLDALNGTRGVLATQLLSNSLSLVNALSKITGFSSLIPGHSRRLLANPIMTESFNSGASTPYEMEQDMDLDGEFPHWFSREGRRLLQTRPTANAVVAQDGTGQYKTIQSAVDAAPTSGARWVIYIKKGIYNEYVNVPKGNKNLMMYGDGPGQTVITGSKSVVGSKVTTFLTSTFTVVAPGFIGRDMTIRNTAGIAGQQAVAMRAGADQQAFANMFLEGYQDTLYTLVSRQFYSGCTIYGTIDYIFGNSAAVFQNCNLLARAGAASSQNTYTANGRTDPGQSTGLSFLSCNVGAAPGLSSTYPTYLGRPWKPYSQTMFIKSNLADCVNPAGWLLWNGDPNSGNNANYGEYGNTGPGANTANRVKWSKQISITDANKFTVGTFISGQQWLPSTSITFNNAL